MASTARRATTLATVERIALADVDGDAVTALVDVTPGADPWCSTLDWVVPAHHAFAPHAEPVVLAGEACMALLARYRLADGTAVLAGMEPLWGFACPLLGPDPAAAAADLAATVANDDDWGALVLAGLPPVRPVLQAIARGLAPLGPAGVAEGIVRQVADLHGDADAFWRRRSARFRRNVRRAQRLAEERGLEIVDASADPRLLERLLRIEARSWKGQQGDGLLSPTMAAFYGDQLDRLQPPGRIRALVARLGGRDVGYIVGGRRGDRYRGLQLSYADEVKALSVGHLLQAAELERLAAEGVATYDLGMELGYKRDWADRAVASVTLVVQRGSAVGRALR